MTQLTQEDIEEILDDSQVTITYRQFVLLWEAAAELARLQGKIEEPPDIAAELPE